MENRIWGMGPSVSYLGLVVVVIVLVAQSYQSLCNPMDCRLPGSPEYRILQARILEWETIPFFKVTSSPRDQTWVSSIAGRSLPSEPPGKPIIMKNHINK